MHRRPGAFGHAVRVSIISAVHIKHWKEAIIRRNVPIP
ncbi:Uncharacterised protein [Actinobacillus pleuropneumoniae]|nr:Uncharacterised protein [Actinobacillus pleuropneumoniae]